MNYDFVYENQSLIYCLGRFLCMQDFYSDNLYKFDLAIEHVGIENHVYNVFCNFLCQQIIQVFLFRE